MIWRKIGGSRIRSPRSGDGDPNHRGSESESGTWTCDHDDRGGHVNHDGRENPDGRENHGGHGNHGGRENPDGHGNHEKPQG